MQLRLTLARPGNLAWPWPRLTPPALVLLAATLAVWNVLTGAMPLASYGDVHLPSWLIEHNALMPRWLVGIFLLHGGHKVVPWLPVRVYISLAAIIAVALPALALAWRGGLRAWLVILCPLVLMIGSGYDEYYPFAMAPLLLLLALVDRPATDVRPIPFGVCLGLLAAWYMPFAGAGLAVGLAYAVTQPRRALLAGPIALLTCAALLHLLWPGGIASYLDFLPRSMSLGEANTFWPPYEGQTIPGSIFFRPGYAFSLAWLKDLAWMGLWSCVIPALALPIAVAIRHRAWRMPLLLAALVVQQILYIWLMVPKLGPRQDIDLHTLGVVVLAYATGSALDRAGVTRPWLVAWAALWGLLGFFILRVIGLPPAP